MFQLKFGNIQVILLSFPQSSQLSRSQFNSTNQGKVFAAWNRYPWTKISQLIFLPCFRSYTTI